MKFIDKIKWRFVMLVKEGKNKKLKVIIYKLLPARSWLGEKIILEEVCNP